MSRIRFISNSTKIIVLLAGLLFIYGTMARVLEIYFFWESKPIGSVFFRLGIISLIGDFLIDKYKEKKYIPPLKLSIMGLFILLYLSILIISFRSDAYHKAIDYLKHSALLDMGEKTISPVTLRSAFVTSTINGRTSGTAVFAFIVKGEKTYKDVIVYLTKNPDEKSWKVIELD